MKYLMLLILASCASQNSKAPACTFFRESTMENLTIRQYNCHDGYKRVCTKTTDEGRSLGCYATRMK